MPAPVEIRGRPAAPGIAAGPLFRIDGEIGRRLPTGDPVSERAALENAVAAAIAQIDALAAASESEAASILEFQAAMLSDDELTAPALRDIESGASAEAAWTAALKEQIVGFETSSDEYFRARAADLADLRDRVLRNLSGADLATPPRGAVLFGADISPTRFLETDWARGGGVALANGSATSHVAMLARSHGVPMVVGLDGIDLDGHSEAMVDGESGVVVLSPGRSERAFLEARRATVAGDRERAVRHLREKARTADGTPIAVMINVARPEELDAIDVETCDGVGLMRTEFLFTGKDLPDEETQYRAYRRVVEWAKSRPVTIRTIDAGGDKPVPGLTVDEPNPFLGVRGIRLSLARPEVFRVQLRALARASNHGNLKVMLPMVTVPGELEAATRLLDAEIADLAQVSTATAHRRLGIMVEVPAVAIAPERFSSAAFFSIGSNDLTQYVTAAARDSHRVADLCDVRNPAVLQLIQNVAEFGTRTGMEVSLCGDAASDPALVPDLLSAGIRSLSVAPTALGAVKAAIAGVRLDGR